MVDHIQKTIDQALEELKKREKAVEEVKRLINQLCSFAGSEPMFEIEDSETSNPAAKTTLVKKNSYYGRPLATCVREYLTARESAGLVREASLDEILGALKEGSFDLRTLCKDEKDDKRVLAISLSKNNLTFHKLPNNEFGLTEWYDIKRRKDRNGTDKCGVELNANDEAISPVGEEMSPGQPEASSGANCDETKAESSHNPAV